MNLLILHQIYTIILFVLFIVIILWTFNKKRQIYFQQASLLPFIDDETRNEDNLHE